MKIVVTRCLNEEKNIDRFVKAYDFADLIIVSDGGSTDRSVELLQKYDKVKLLHFKGHEIINGYYWNPDNTHIQFIIDDAKRYNPEWIILDDLDDVPNKSLQEKANYILDRCAYPQVNAFRLYMWGDDKYFPKMNNYFDQLYTSLWAWKPDELYIRTDMNVRHGTLIGLGKEYYNIDLPMCLLHKSWHPDTIDEKIKKYNTIGLPMNHPLTFAGELENLPDWAVE